MGGRRANRLVKIVGQIQQARRTGPEGFRSVPYREQRHILLTAFHTADMGAIDAHALGNCLLAQPG